MPSFYSTTGGKRVIEHIIPESLKAIVGIHTELKEANRLRAQHIELVSEQNETLARIADKPAEDIRLRQAEATLHAVKKMVENTMNLDKQTRNMLLDELRGEQ